MKKKYSGVVVPAVTPLNEDITLDEAAVEKMFSNFYAHNVMPFILGTTGESASIPVKTKNAYIRKAALTKQAGTVLYAGISSNCVEESVIAAKYCSDHGVDVVVATVASYFALTEYQLLHYFTNLADESPLPVIIYNIPATTHLSLPLPVLDRLSYHPNIVGAKDSERSDERLQQSIALWKNRNDFSHFVGWAARSAPALIEGSDGIIPSTGNVFPSVYAQMLDAVTQGNLELAYQLQKISDQLGNIYQGGKTLGESLWALKVLMQAQKLCKPIVMPPLLSLPNEAYEELQTVLKDWLKENNF
jgi:4-hydroxy-tetrahydrodipicolinate synthase